MRLKEFKVTNYRNIRDSGWIDVGQITAFVGQNEAGKSNLFEALSGINSFIPTHTYNVDEDWPVDDWGNKDPNAVVCEAKFDLSSPEIAALYGAAAIPKALPAAPESQSPSEASEGEASTPSPAPQPVMPLPPERIELLASRSYNAKTSTSFTLNAPQADLDLKKADAWIRDAIPKFVYIQEYELPGTSIELNILAEHLDQRKWHELTNEEQIIKIILDLAQINISDFLKKGNTPEGRTVRVFDKKSASAYLSKQFRDLWKQKRVNFDIEIDGTTLNIFAQDDEVGMPVRLNRRSSGFRWHVSFAWKFTHASKGQYKGCILLLEEPGIHLHYSGQRDLLEVFERLSSENMILYTTHLASMVDLAFPERVRIVETRDHHTVVKKGVVSSQRAPMAVIEVALGLTGGLGGLLGSRQTLIVEGGDDALVLHKLSGIMRAAGKPHLSERVYLWPAMGAQKTPMYAAFAVEQGWDSGVLLDTDAEGLSAKKKIDQLLLKDLATEQQAKFRVLMIGEAAGIKKTDAAIEDLFDDAFFIDCVNTTFGILINESDLPVDGSDMITKRIQQVLVKRYGHKELDRRRVMIEILRRFDGWETLTDLPPTTGDKAAKLFSAINTIFGATAPTKSK